MPIPTPEEISKYPFTNRNWLAITITSVLIAGLVGFLIRPYLLPETKLAGKKAADSFVKTASILAAIDHQVAIYGKVTKVEGLTATIRNNKNQTAKLPLSSSLAVYKKPGQLQATSSAALKAIKLNTQALISLEYKNGKYKVVSITYNIPKRQPTTASPSATPKK